MSDRASKALADLPLYQTAATNKINYGQ